MSRLALCLLLLAAAVVLTACSSRSSGTKRTGATAAASTAYQVTTSLSQTPADRLRAAARAAVLADHRLSVRVLWTNRVPVDPTATAGPALTNLRQSVAARRQRGLRIRLASERFRIVSLRLDPSYTRGSAVVSDRQRAQPFGRDGKPLGRPVTLDERVRLEVRRLGSSERFVVWRVAPLR